MAQHDGILQDQDGASFLSDLADFAEAVLSTSKGPSRPATVYAGQLWIDDNTPSASVWSVYFYDGSDDVKVGEIDSSGNNFMPFVNGSSLTDFLEAYTFPGTEASLPSAATTNLGSTGVFAVAITGTTTITSFGSGASASAPLYFVRFTGALQLTHHATSLILPGGGNITTAAGATAVMLYLGSGNWRMLSYEPALAANQLLGVGSSGGKAAISLGNGMSMSGTTLSASGSSSRVTFEGSTGGIYSSAGVSSVTDNGVGDYTVNLSPSLGTAYYTVAGVAADNIIGNSNTVTLDHSSLPTTSSYRIKVRNDGGGPVDVAYVCAVTFGG